MAERKPNGGGGAANTSSSGTNLLFSSSATEFSFNVPFIPVTQAAVASASLLLPGGSGGGSGGTSVCGEAGGGREATRVGWEVFLLCRSDSLGSLPGPSVARFEWLGGFEISEAGARSGDLLFVQGALCSEGWTLHTGADITQIFVEHLLVC